MAQNIFYKNNGCPLIVYHWYGCSKLYFWSNNIGITCPSNVRAFKIIRLQHPGSQ